MSKSYVVEFATGRRHYFATRNSMNKFLRRAAALGHLPLTESERASRSLGNELLSMTLRGDSKRR